MYGMLSNQYTNNYLSLFQMAKQTTSTSSTTAPSRRRSENPEPPSPTIRSSNWRNGSSTRNTSHQQIETRSQHPSAFPTRRSLPGSRTDEQSWRETWRSWRKTWNLQRSCLPTRASWRMWLISVSSRRRLSV